MKKLSSIFAAIFIAVSISSCAKDATNYSEVTTVIVIEGEDLWTIASRQCTNEYDIREVIQEIKRINNLPNSGVYANQIIKVPVYD